MHIGNIRNIRNIRNIGNIEKTSKNIEKWSNKWWQMVRKTPKNNRKSWIWGLLGVDFNSLQQVLTGPDQVWTDSHRFSSKSDRFFFQFFMFFSNLRVYGHARASGPWKSDAGDHRIPRHFNIIAYGWNPGPLWKRMRLENEKWWNSTLAALAPDKIQ